MLQLGRVGHFNYSFTSFSFQADTDKKLPVIYLLDSIIKNVGGVYLQLFSKNIINTYCNAFEKLDTNNRISMVHLLKTWIGVFPQEQVSAIQDRISALVPSNPTAAQSATQQQPAIHVNPRYLQRSADRVSTRVMLFVSDE
jgi:pre-mRNA cleavage complex 2 protein Pcf11